MTNNIQKLVVMFADISGSTALYDNLGDVPAQRLISSCLATMTSEIISHNGSVVKTIGDEIMCTYSNVIDAFNAACAMQLAVTNSNRDSSQPMYIRIGFHYGDVIYEHGDVFGDTTNVAAHVAKTTRANHILATQAVIDALPEDLRSRTRRIMRSDFKGKQESFEIFMIIWSSEDLGSTRIGLPAYRKFQDDEHNLELRLNYHDHSLVINKRHGPIMLGREEICQLVVQNDLASRQHVRIELRMGKFFLIDQSTNGTYIRFNNGNVVCVTCNEIALEGSGYLSLGESFSERSVDPVEFSILPVLN